MKVSRQSRESGAALVEMAMVLPLVVLLLFGMIEASWAFAQANDVRHGTREGARLAAVDYGDVAAIGTEVCDRMDIAGGTITVSLSDGSGGVDDGSRGS
ncbi:MAG: TadE/TadG family type IV pilus assembly protein, partial [Acidimicrobiia bacterium]